MKTNLIIVRHGQSMANLEHSFAGLTDVPLSPLGHRQAQATANYLANEPIDVILSSPLLRAYQTAEPIAKSHGMPIIKVEDLHEIYGGEWEGMTWAQIGAQYGELFVQWNNDFSRVCCPGGDNMIDTFARARKVLLEICTQYEGKTVCFATHAGLMRSMRGHFLGGAIESLNEIKWATNASVTRATYENGVFTPVSYSEDAHLAGMESPFSTKA